MITEDNQAEQSAQLLSQANLHRMRQEWDEAVTSCMQVLYSDPNNWRAHALLGDIYADQKRPDEAIRWYCMTLDIRPDSHSTRDKLNHVVTSRRQEFVESLDPTRTLVNRTGKFYKNNLFGKVSWQWSAPERKKRLLAASGVALLILLVVAVPALTGKNQSGQKPVFGPGTPTASTLFLQPVPDSKESSSSNSTNGTTSNQQASQPNQSASANSDTSDSSSGSASNLHDSNESALITGLSTDQTLTTAGIHVTDAEIDPPTNTVSVTYACDTASEPLTPDRILRAGLMVGKEAMSRPEGSSAQTCVVRCLTVASPSVADAASMAAGSSSSAAQAPSLVFLATLPRSAVNDSPSVDKITDFQISQAFSTIWWAQGSQASQPQSANSVTTPSPTP